MFVISYSLTGALCSFSNQTAAQHQERFPNYPVPVARLARLAVDQGQQGKGLGKLLLLDALYRCHRLSEEIGSVGVIVDAKNARAQSFYGQMNFEEFPDTPLTLCLPIKAISRLFGGTSGQSHLN